MNLAIESARPSPRLEAARLFAAKGWRVMRLHYVLRDGSCSCMTNANGQSSRCEMNPNQRGKHPRDAGWQDLATTDPATIESWFRGAPWNVGIRAGRLPNGKFLSIIDVDRKHGGLENWQALCAEQGGIPPTVTFITGSGGMHVLFETDVEVRNYQDGAKIVTGVDVRGEGGLIVGPTSKHPSGELYKFAPGLGPNEMPLAPAPAWLLERMLACGSGGRRAASTSDSAPRVPPAPPPGEAAEGPDGRVLEYDLTGLIPASIAKGTKPPRHGVVLSLAGTLRSQGLDGDEIFAVLDAVDKARCSPPLGEDYVRNKLISYVLREPPRHPLATALTSSERKRALKTLATVLRKRGLNEAEITPGLRALNTARCRPPLTDAQITDIARRIPTVPEPASPLAEGAPANDNVPGAGAVSADGACEPGHQVGGVVRPFQVGDAVELAEQLAIDLRRDSPAPVVFTEGTFWRYDPACGAFVEVPEKEPLGAVAKYSRFPVGSGESTHPLALTRRAIQDAVALCAAALSPDGPDFFKSATPGIAFRNTFVALTPAGLEPRPHSPDHRARHALPFDYDPTALCPRWGQFLREVFTPVKLSDDGQPIDDGEDRAAVLQEFLGAALLGIATRYGKAVVMVGEGSNGKSVVIKVTSAPFPLSARSAISPQRWGKSFFLAGLAGKRLNAVAEMPSREIAESDLFKGVVTADPQTADHKHKPAFQFVPEAAHLFACNTLPATRDHSEGFWRRFIVLHFGREFTAEEQDENLAEDLIARELPGIVMWMLEGARRLLAQRRYTVPASSVAAKAAWRRDADQVQQFVEDCVSVTPDSSRQKHGDAVPAAAIGVQELYDTYNYWARRTGHQPVSKDSFSKRAAKLLARGHSESHRWYWVTLNAHGRSFRLCYQ